MEAIGINFIALGKRIFCLSFFMTLSGVVCALEWDVGVNASSDFTDNALRVAENTGEETISERQDRYGANIQALHNGDRVNLQANYELGYSVFTENSQIDRDTRSGRARLALGKASDILGLNLEHSVQMTLVEPGAVQILQNLEERSISLIQPVTNFHVGAVDTIHLIGNLQEIMFEEQELRNSSRKGALFQWVHLFNRRSSFTFDVSRENVEFEFFPVADYELEYVALTYSSTLRRFDYTLTIGKNRSVREGEQSYSGGRYTAEMNYRGDSSTVGFRASKSLTDSSQGAGNEASLVDDEVETDPGSFGQADQFESKSEEIYWEADVFCTRCVLAATLSSTEERYLAGTEQDNKSLNASLRFSYNFNTRSSLQLQFLKSEREFIGFSDRDFDSTRTSIAYQRALGVNLGLRISASQLVRENTFNSISGDIQENIYGLSLNYRF